MKRTCLVIVTMFLLIGLASTAIAATEEDVFALEMSAKTGDRASVRKLFELYHSTDGAATEDIDMILGDVVRSHPQMFLEELKRARPESSVCSNVGNTLGLTDNTRKQLEALRARRKALLSVHDKSLVALRNDCVSRLDKEITIFVNAEKAMSESK